MSGKFGPGKPRIVDVYAMPQATNVKVMREKEFCPVGPGTVLNKVHHISDTIRDRVRLVNKTEGEKLEKIYRLIDKEHRFNTNLQNKVIQRTTKTQKERQALYQLLEHDYRIHKFITLKDDFDSRTICEKETARRYVIESRVLNSGFNMKAMRPEVYRRMRRLDPNHKYKTFKRHLLADYRDKNVEINRSINTPMFHKMLHAGKNWREFNYPPDDERWRSTENVSEGLARASKPEISEQNIEPEMTSDEIEAVKKENVEADTGREKSVVLERRLARPKNTAHSMTLNTLGPVYFQTSTVTDLQTVTTT